MKTAAIRMLIALLVLIIIMSAALVFGVVQKNASAVPSLALDLEGGTQLILRPKAEGDKGGRTQVSENDLKEAIEVIRQRVDASGVTEAEITSLGGRNIVVSLPGHPSEETLDLVRQSAQLVFRPVLQVGAPISELNLAQNIDQKALDKLQGEEKKQAEQEIAAAKENPEAFLMARADKNGDGKLSEEPEAKPADNSDLSWISEKVQYDFMAKDCTKIENRKGGSADDPKKPLVTCQKDGSSKYILGPVDLEGTHIKTASSGMKPSQGGGTTGEWIVNISFDSVGTEKFGKTSQRLFAFRNTGAQPGAEGQPQLPQQGGSDPRNRFAIVLDGTVVSAPGIENPITNGQAMIEGGFTKTSSSVLANQLQFGSLPLNFDVQSQQQVSATLGADQLRFGVIAGIIGMLLIVLFMLWEYRGLSLVSVGSLIMSGVLAYLIIALLSWLMGYRLSLAGVAGIIISIGTTADSFIVYFERIRDEVRDGRPLRSAVDEGWTRAKRTIVSADMMNLIAAGVLYFLAVGNVQGFAFTLGVMTFIDLIVIFMFTHPLLVLLVRTAFYGEGHRWSGLDPEHLGASKRTYRYKGRGRFEQEKPSGTRVRLGAPSTDDDAEEDNKSQRTSVGAVKDSPTDDETASEGSDAK